MKLTRRGEIVCGIGFSLFLIGLMSLMGAIEGGWN